MPSSFWLPAIAYMLLLLTCLNQLSSAQNRRKRLLVIAVEDAEIHTFLSTQTASADLTKAAFPYVETTGISLTLVYLPIKDSLESVSKTDTVIANLTQMDAAAVISDYYISLAIATYTLGLPYFVIRKNVFSFPPPNTPNIFEIEIDNYHMGQALYDIAMVYKRSTLVVVSDGTPQSSQFLVHFDGRIFSTFVVNNTNTNKEIYSVFSRFAPNALPSGMGWILLFDEPNLPLMQRTLEQASRAGIFAVNQVFFIPSLFDKQEYLTRFYRSNIEILTFLLADGKYYKKSELLHPFVIDCLNHFLKAYKAWSSMSADVTISKVITDTLSISNPHTGLYIYHPANRIRARVQIDVMHTNESKASNSSSIYTLAGIWQKDGTDTPPYKPNYAVADDLGESRIVFVAYESPPYFYGYDPSTGTGRGLGLEMIEVLRAKLGFEYKVVVASGREEALQKLKKREADVSLNFIAPSKERLNYTDASIDMVQDGVQMLTRKVIRGLDFGHIFHPFSSFVWLSIGIIIVLMTVTLFACDKISPNTSESEQFFTIQECFFLVLSSFLLAKSNAQPKKVSSRLFILLLRFSSLMYIMAYLSNQVALLIQSDEQINISSVSELNDLIGYKWGFLKNSMVPSEVQSNWPKVYARALREWPNEMFFNSLEDGLAKVLSDPNYILIESADTLSFIKTTDCKFLVMGNIGSSHQLTWLYRKGFAFGKELNNQLGVEKTGVFIQMRSKYFELNRCYTGRTDIENKVQLGFEYLYGLFVLLGVGLMLGFVYLFCQSVSQRMKEWKKVQKQTFYFKLGQIYAAEVFDANKKGLWIRIAGDNEVRFMDNSYLRHEDEGDACRCNAHLKGKAIKVQYIGTCGVSGARIFKKPPGSADIFEVENPDLAGSELTQGQDSCSV